MNPGAERLDQAAVDLLLEQAKEGREGGLREETSVEPYDFARPGRLGGTARAVLDPVQDATAGVLRRSLSIVFRTQMEAEPMDVEVVSFSDLAQSLGVPCAAFLFPVAHEHTGFGLADLGGNTALAAVDRLLGGTGRPIAVSRQLTAVEQALARRLADRILPDLAGVWKEVLAFEPRILRFEPDPARARLCEGEERFLVSLVRVRGPEFEDVVTVALPYGAVEARLEGERAASGDVPAADRAAVAGRLGESELRHAHLTVAARLPAVRLTLREVNGLQPGQVLDTGHPVDAPIGVHVNDRLVFLGMPGRHGGHLGLRITQRASTSRSERLVRARRGRIQ